MFESAFARLQICLEQACAARAGWPERVAAAIDAGLRFATADPAAARLLTDRALAQGRDGLARYQRLLAFLAEGLRPGCRERPDGELLSGVTEKAMVGGVLSLVAQRLSRGEEAELPALAAEATQFVLTPYLGAEEARRIGIEQIGGSS